MQHLKQPDKTLFFSILKHVIFFYNISVMLFQTTKFKYTVKPV